MYENRKVISFLTALPCFAEDYSETINKFKKVETLHSYGVGNGQEQSGGTYVNGMAVFVDGIEGLMYEASISGQKFSFKPL